MRKVKPVFDTNDTVATYAFWRTEIYPFTNGGRIIGVYSDSFKVDSDEKYIREDYVLFALRVDDGVKLVAEIKAQRSKYETSVEMMTRRLDDYRRRSVLGQLDPKEVR